MPKKAFCTAFLTGLSFLLFAQPALVISPASLPNGNYGSTYAQTFTAAGGMSPYSFSVSNGSLPPGMTMSGGGVLSGAPAAAGTYKFTITARDTSGPQGPHGGQGDQGDHGKHGQHGIDSGSRDYTLIVIPALLKVSANAETKQFGAPDPALTYTVSGFLNGDNSGIFTGSLSRTPGEQVGSYPITIGTLGATGGNYTISFTGNTLTITRVSQEITWSQTLSIGCNTTTQVQLTATASSGLPVTYTVSDNSIATVSGNVLTLLQPGTAVVTAAQAGNANYGAAPAVSDTVLYQSASLISQHWDDAIFFDNSSGDYIAWQWYKNDSLITGATSPYYSETPLDGQYFVIATKKDRQQTQTCTLTITPGAAIPGGIRAFPNPAGKGIAVTVTCNYAVSALQGAILQIAEVNGRVLRQITNVQPTMQVTMPSATGIYIMDLLLAGGQRASVNVLVRN